MGIRGAVSSLLTPSLTVHIAYWANVHRGATAHHSASIASWMAKATVTTAGKANVTTAGAASADDNGAELRAPAPS